MEHRQYTQILKGWGVVYVHVHSTFQMQSLVFKTSPIDTEFPKYQDISVCICRRFFCETFWEVSYLSTQTDCETDE